MVKWKPQFYFYIQKYIFVFELLLACQCKFYILTLIVQKYYVCVVVAYKGTAPLTSTLVTRTIAMTSLDVIVLVTSC